MKKTTEKSNSLYTGGQMKYNWTFNYIIIMAMILLLSNMSLAWGVCGPCYSGTWPNCTWKGCQPPCDGTACKYCNETAGCVCKSWCSSGQSCCNDSPEGICYGNGWQCCGDGHLCPAEDICCNGGCCYTSQCMECKDGSCQSKCDPNDCEICDEQGSCISTCDSSVCQKTCINGSCQPCGGDLDMVCCLDGTETCCNWVIGETCCNGDCCEQSCCNSFDCEYCDGESCQPCLRKVGTYAELQMCSYVVDDPDTEPSPNGCSNPVSSNPDNPAGYVCGEASSFLNACNAHDTCYQTCGSNKIEECDAVFDWNLWTVCNPLSGECRDACLDKKSLYVGFVLTMGEAWWREGQVGACACCDCN
jgi:hypothetical protein